MTYTDPGPPLPPGGSECPLHAPDRQGGPFGPWPDSPDPGWAGEEELQQVEPGPGPAEPHQARAAPHGALQGEHGQAGHQLRQVGYMNMSHDRHTPKGWHAHVQYARTKTVNVCYVLIVQSAHTNTHPYVVCLRWEWFVYSGEDSCKVMYLYC